MGVAGELYIRETWRRQEATLPSLHRGNRTLQKATKHGWLINHQVTPGYPSVSLQPRAGERKKRLGNLRGRKFLPSSLSWSVATWREASQSQNPRVSHAREIGLQGRGIGEGRREGGCKGTQNRSFLSRDGSRQAERNDGPQGREAQSTVQMSSDADGTLSRRFHLFLSITLSLSFAPPSAIVQP